MFAAESELVTESDVEQKLLWRLLTEMAPAGLGYAAADVLTKPNIRRLEIDKGTARRLYYPDYVVVLAGFPVLIVEAKAPGESVVQALAEARLYSNEINALFPSGINPCVRVIACNGRSFASGPVDSRTPDIELGLSEISISSPGYATLVGLCSAEALQARVDEVRRAFRRSSYRRAVSLVGGTAFQQEELPPNTFGATIVGDYGHIFNPRSKDERAYVAKNAYIPSLRRQRHIEPIDRLIRGAVSPSTGMIPVLGNTGEPREITKALRERKQLENQVMLLVGSVGVGKSTFVDYVSLVALPDDIREKTVWVRVNLNDAPLSAQVAYDWFARAVVAELRVASPDVDFDELEALERVFAPEIKGFKKGAISLLDSSSEEYRRRLVDHLIALQGDQVGLAKAMARFACGGPGKLLVVVLDNCDKRTRDEQLTMFQIAQWVQNQFRCLVVLPLRDVTFDRHRNEPPLDTALKGLVFRIEPPPLTEVLQARVRLALEEMQAERDRDDNLNYVLPNGIRVSYPASDQGLYLASILRSIYAHDRFVRQVMTGLAGRDVRRALEIFLDFCTSGHIGEDEIYKIRFFEGQYLLPLSVVARVLLRMQRRFYDGDKAYLKNLTQCDPDDPLPDHFVRLAILHWLHHRQSEIGPAGVQGFHSVGSMVRDLVHLGHDAHAVRREVLYLVREGCIFPEHLRMDEVADNDLAKISASGVVHLQLMANPDYLAACAEDTWLSDGDLALRIAGRIGGSDRRTHTARTTTSRNAREFVEYLKARSAERVAAPEVFLEIKAAKEINALRETEAAVAATEVEVATRLCIRNLHYDVTREELHGVLRDAGVDVESISMPPSNSGRVNRGFAFIQVRDPATAMRAMDELDIHVRGRRVEVSEAHPTQGANGEPRRQAPRGVTERLYVGNLPSGATEDVVRRLFEGHDFRPLDVYVPFDRASRQPKGFAFVSLRTQAEAELAIGALAGTTLDQRRLVVRPADPRGTGAGTSGGSPTW